MNRTLPKTRSWPELDSEAYWKLMLQLQAFTDTPSRRKLERLRIDLRDGADKFQTANLLKPASQYVKWDSQAAKTVAESWWPRIQAEFSTLIVCGRRVADAFSLQRLGKIEDCCGLVQTIEYLNVIIIPHPSGLNLWWNDKNAVDDLQERLETCLS